MSVFGQVWLWSLAAFVLGALLTWLLLVRPARARVRELERRVVAHRSEPVAAPAGHAEPTDDAALDAHVAPSDYLAEPEFESSAYDERTAGQRSATDYPATELFEPANPEHTEYLPPVDGRTRVDFAPVTSRPDGPAVGTALDPDQGETVESQHAAAQHTEFEHPGLPYEESPYVETPYEDSPPPAPEPARGLFQPALPSTPLDEPDVEPTVEEPVPEPAGAEADPDEPAADGMLPKRQRRESPLGGFDPPEPIQPSMRAVARREPMQNGHSGSLFEPGTPAEAEPGEEHGAGPEAQSAAEQSEPGAPVGPFGPGSAMPLLGGAKPSEDFTVKASVTTLRYCPPESERFADMVAEVWFRSAQDAERVGFRPIG